MAAYTPKTAAGEGEAGDLIDGEATLDELRRIAGTLGDLSAKLSGQRLSAATDGGLGLVRAAAGVASALVCARVDIVRLTAGMGFPVPRDGPTRGLVAGACRRTALFAAAAEFALHAAGQPDLDASHVIWRVLTEPPETWAAEDLVRCYPFFFGGSSSGSSCRARADAPAPPPPRRPRSPRRRPRSSRWRSVWPGARCGSAFTS